VGWIGVDVGATTVKVAQLRRVGDRLELAGAAVAPRWPDAAAPANESRCREVQSARALAGSLRGKHAAAVLSMSACRLQPTRGEQGASLAVPACVDRWLVSGDDGYLLEAPQADVVSLCEGLGRAGLECQTIDGEPLAIARALRLSADYTPERMLAGLDWGSASATFVAGRNGIAQYARSLKVEGVASLFQSVAAELAISLADAERLVLRRGLRQESGDPPNPARAPLLRSIEAMASELKRTLNHLGGKLKSKGPERVYLFGAGGVVPGLAEAIGDRAGVVAEPWRAARVKHDESPASPTPPDCLLGAAIALSALAWEGAP
jgi:Tfp pilus assembly PilM family ATPase